MTSFERSDVTVYEDGVRQEILTFQKSTDRPLSLALLIDISGSEKRRLIEEKMADRIQPVKGVLGYQGKGTILPAGAKPATGSLSYTSAIWDALWITSRHLF
jgi:hypothetical protein